MAVTSQNYLQEKVRSGLISGNAYYCSFQCVLPSILPSVNLVIKIYETAILSVRIFNLKLGWPML